MFTTATDAANPSPEAMQAVRAKVEVNYPCFANQLWRRMRIVKEDRATIKPSLVFQVGLSAEAWGGAQAFLDEWIVTE